jgi:PKD repeat protein
VHHKFYHYYVKRQSLFIPLLAVFILLSSGIINPLVAQDPDTIVVIQGAEAGPSVVPGSFDGDIQELPKAKIWKAGESVREVNKRLTHSFTDNSLAVSQTVVGDPLVEIAQDARKNISRVFTTPALNFAGQDYTGVAPPDTIGDVGPNHYIQMINHSSGASVTIYDKSGSTLAGPIVLSSLWTAGGNCASGLGDPIVLYDRLADRWLMSEFASSGNHLCVYISKTNDPVSGGWWLYDFTTPNFPDYPKYGVWPDGYYVSTNESGGPAVYALERDAMLNGDPATSQRFTGTSLTGFGFQALIPSTIDGTTAPPAGSPNYFMRHRDDEVHNPGSNDPTKDFIEIWEFHVDWTTPANSTFMGPTNIDIAEFDSDLCGLSSFECFPQPGTSVGLDPLREVIMWRLAYRNFGSHETITGNFVTDVTGSDQGGVRWFELRDTGSGWALEQEGTFSPDSTNRWMGSIAMDKVGNIALGYSVSDSSVFPSIRYTGREASDPAGTMTQGETTIINGVSSQTSFTRWGDYSSMNVDPADDCTFWYTNEYVGFGGQWQTQIASFSFDSCTGVTTGPAIDVAPGSISSTQAPDTTAEETLTISNTGTGGDLNWIIDEALFTISSVNTTSMHSFIRGAYPPRRLGRTAPASQSGVAKSKNRATLANAVEDGSFEAGTPNPNWDESSTNFGSPICDVASCGTGTGTGPNTGTYWAWFGGISAVEEGSLSQDVTFPSRSPATLSFFLEQIVCADPADFLEVLIDGTQVFFTDGSSPLCGNLGYTLQEIDVSAFADGGTHTLEFHSLLTGTGNTNFFVDDVMLEGPCSSPDVISWLDLSSTNGTTAAGSSTDVTVTLDSSGLAVDTYEALLCVNSDDPATPLVEVPVTMTVSDTIPAINVTPMFITSTQAPSTTTTETLSISNTGSGSLDWTIDEAEAGGGTSCDSPTDFAWLSVSPASGSTTSGTPSEVIVTIDSAGLTSGTVEATLCINSNDPATPRAEVPVTLTVEGVNADFTADVTSGIVPFIVQFTDQSSGPVSSWSWNFGDGGTSADQNPSHTYNIPGVYTVSITVGDNGNTDTETKEAYITVDPIEPDFQIRKGVLFDKIKGGKDNLNILLKEVSQLSEAVVGLADKTVLISITSGDTTYYEEEIPGSNFDEKRNGKKFVYKNGKTKYILFPTKDKVKLKDKKFDFDNNFPENPNPIEFSLEITGYRYIVTSDWDAKVKRNGVKAKVKRLNK